MSLEALANHLEIVLLRVQSGESLVQALREGPKLKIARETCESWEQLRNSILEGQLSTELGLRSFAEQLRLQQELRSKVREKTLIPKLQLYTILVAAVCFGLFSQKFLPAEIQIDFQLLSLSFVLLALALAWLYFEFHFFEKKLWYCQWLYFIGNVHSQVIWGRTLPTAFAHSLNTRMLEAFPRSLRSILEDFLEQLCSGKIDLFQGAPVSKIAGDQDQVLEELRVLARLEARGQGPGFFLERRIKEGLKSFDRRLSIESQMLSFRLLIPLFLFCVPGFLILIFGPLIQSLGLLTL